MFDFAPSIANVFPNPMIPILATGFSDAISSGRTGAVVGLSKVSIQSHGRRRIDDATVFLLQKVGPRCFADLALLVVVGVKSNLVGATQMNTLNQVPIAIRHARKRLVTQNTAISDFLDTNPALLTTMSMRPNALMAVSINLSPSSTES
jgi:hypothetical protein